MDLRDGGEKRLFLYGRNFVAFDAADGDLVWHTRIGDISNAPETYALDGRQYVLVAVDDRLFTFAMY